MSRDSLLYVSMHPPRCYVLTQRVHHGVSGLVGASLLARTLRGKARLISLPLLIWGLTDLRDARVWLRRDRIVCRYPE